MLKCDFSNFIEIAPQHGFVYSYKVAAYFQNIFP